MATDDLALTKIERIERQYQDGETTIVHRFSMGSQGRTNHTLDCILLPKGTRTEEADLFWLVIQRLIAERYPSAEFVWLPGVPKLLYLSDEERVLVEFAVDERRVETAVFVE